MHYKLVFYNEEFNLKIKIKQHHKFFSSSLEKIELARRMIISNSEKNRFCVSDIVFQRNLIKQNLKISSTYPSERFGL